MMRAQLSAINLFPTTPRLFHFLCIIRNVSFSWSREIRGITQGVIPGLLYSENNWPTLVILQDELGFQMRVMCKRFQGKSELHCSSPVRGFLIDSLDESMVVYVKRCMDEYWHVVL